MHLYIGAGIMNVLDVHLKWRIYKCSRKSPDFWPQQGNAGHPTITPSLPLHTISHRSLSFMSRSAPFSSALSLVAGYYPQLSPVDIGGTPTSVPNCIRNELNNRARERPKEMNRNGYGFIMGRFHLY